MQSLTARRNVLQTVAISPWQLCVGQVDGRQGKVEAVREEQRGGGEEKQKASPHRLAVGPAPLPPFILIELLLSKEVAGFPGAR